MPRGRRGQQGEVMLANVAARWTQKPWNHQTDQPEETFRGDFDCHFHFTAGIITKNIGGHFHTCYMEKQQKCGLSRGTGGVLQIGSPVKI